MRDLKKKSKCRITDRPIGLFLVGPEDIPHAWRSVKMWLYTDVPQAEALSLCQTDNVKPLPQDFCWRTTSLGDECTAKIRPENVRAQLWACGRHMARFQEEQDRVRRNEEARKMRLQKEELSQWELQRHIDAYNRLQELGWGAILSQDPPKISWGTNIRGNRILELPLLEFLELVEPTPEEEEYEDDDEFETVSEEFFASDL